MDNTTTKVEDEILEDSFIFVFDKIQLVFAIIGAFLNLATYIILWASTSIAPMMSLVMKYQACFDFLVCAMGTVILVQPPNWLTGNIPADIAVCQLWHSQALYWGVFALAGWNLVGLAIERHMAIVRPIFYQTVGRKHIYYYLLPLYAIGFVCNLPAYFETNYRNGTCHSEYFFSGPIAEGFFHFYHIFYFFSFYFIPCVLLFLLYGHIIYTLRLRQSSNLGGGSTSTIDRATSQMTKCAVMVTVIFILSIGPDSWLYMLSSLEAAPYVYNSPLQKIMVFLTLINSCANPVVYIILLPAFRHDARKMATCSRRTTSRKSLNPTSSRQSISTVE